MAMALSMKELIASRQVSAMALALEYVIQIFHVTRVIDGLVQVCWEFY
jgi:hypothetical protein